MPGTIAPPAEQQEPTLRDVLDAVNGLGTRVGSLETKMDSFGCRMDLFETRMDSFETRMDSLETKVDSLDTKIDSVEANLGSRIDSLETKVDSVETNLGSRIDSLETKVDSVETNLGSRIDSLKVDIHEVARETAAHIVSAISDAKVELGARITKVDDRLTEVRGDVATLKKAGEYSIGVQHDVEIMRRSLRNIEPYAEEAVKLGRGNRDALQALTTDVAQLDRKFDLHIADHEVHLPRPRTMPASDAGPVAA